MLLGVGVDLLHLTRLRAMLARREPARLAARILSDEESAQWNDLAASPDQSERFLALRCVAKQISSREQDADRSQFSTGSWTAKEAAYKALYPAIVARWADLTVSKQGPKPILSWSTSSPKFVRPPTVDPDRVRLHLSVSHDADLMVAYVLAELLDKRA